MMATFFKHNAESENMHYNVKKQYALLAVYISSSAIVFHVHLNQPMCLIVMENISVDEGNHGSILLNTRLNFRAWIKVLGNWTRSDIRNWRKDRKKVQ
jgi:hypothetical protein